MLYLPSYSQNAFYHIALEDFLVRNFRWEEDLLLLYENEEAVVVGKNQCIYKEVNFAYLYENEKKVARRISGGGTVFHCKGNLCFSIITTFDNSKLNNYAYFNQPIIDALRKLNIEATMNHRSDIIVDGKKISGNAQFTNRKFILSHGTLLVNAPLENLSFALKKNDFSIMSKSVESVRSKVENISTFQPEISSAEILKNYLLKTLPISNQISITENEQRTVAEKQATIFSQNEWIWGRCPFTTIEKSNLKVTLNEGKIMTVNDVKFKDEAVYFIPSALQRNDNTKKLLTTFFQ